MRLRHLITIAAVVGMASPSWADWQFTRWGMTPEQVEAASGGRAPMVPPQVSEAGTVFNIGPYSSGDHSFTAKYSYKSRRLSAITLEMNSSCGSLKDDLKTRYGNPLADDSLRSMGETSRWIDTKRNNAILMLDFLGSCYLIYSEAKSSSREGL